MVEAKAGSASKDNRKTDAATSGKNAMASSTSKDGNGSKETTRSWSEQTPDGTFVTKFFSRNDDRDESNDHENKDDKSRVNGYKAETDEGGAFASAGKGAFAGIIDGKAVATTN